MEKNKIKVDLHNDLNENEGAPNISEEKTDLETAANNTNEPTSRINNENNASSENFVLKKEEAEYFASPNPQNNQFTATQNSFNFINQRFMNQNNFYNFQNNCTPSVYPNTILIVYPSGQNTVNTAIPISNINALNRPIPFTNTPIFQSSFNSTANNVMPFLGNFNNNARNLHLENSLNYSMMPRMQTNSFFGLPRNCFYN